MNNAHGKSLEADLNWPRAVHDAGVGLQRRGIPLEYRDIYTFERVKTKYQLSIGFVSPVFLTKQKASAARLSNSKQLTVRPKIFSMHCPTATLGPIFFEKSIPYDVGIFCIF